MSAYMRFAPLRREPLPMARTAFAVNTNSPSESIAGMESDVPVPGPFIGPVLRGKLLVPPVAKSAIPPAAKA